MTFTAGEPADGESLGSSKPKIRTNLDLLRTTLAINHIDVNATGAGKHKFMQIPISPGVTLPGNVNEGLFYTKSGTNTDLYYSPDAGSKQYELTKTDDANFATFATNPGWTFLPGGLIIQYGTIAVPVSHADTAITFAGLGVKAFPNACFGVFANLQRSGTNNVDTVYTFTYLATGFSYRYTSSTIVPFNWFAIGN